MAITPTRSERYGRTHVYAWENLLTADGVGEPATAPGGADASVHVFGAFNGASVTIEGSNELVPTDWQPLSDHIGDLLTFTSTGLRAIAENTLHVRPVLTGGASSDVTVLILRRKTS